MKLLAERALVRAVSARYPKCIREKKNVPIDLDRARLQHAAYVKALEAAGILVEWLPPLDDAPDAVFVEDTAVILGVNVLITRPGAEARRREVPSVSAAIDHPHHEVPEPGTIDGGDVLHTGERIFAGVSARTNESGIEALRRAAKVEGVEVSTIRLKGGLHLKSACSLLEPKTIVFWPKDLDPKPFGKAGFTCLAVPEPQGANILALGKKVLVSAAAPRTFELLSARGHDCVRVDVSEIHKGDGALTCLSLRFPAPDAFAT
jgi:dimethylargininase